MVLGKLEEQFHQRKFKFSLVGVNGLHTDCLCSTAVWSLLFSFWILRPQSLWTEVSSRFGSPNTSTLLRWLVTSLLRWACYAGEIVNMFVCRRCDRVQLFETSLLFLHTFRSTPSVLLLTRWLVRRHNDLLHLMTPGRVTINNFL